MENTAEKAAENTIKKASPKKPEAVYTVSQLAEGHKAFDTSRAIVECALKLSKKEIFTMDEARKIVDTFKNKR